MSETSISHMSLATDTQGTFLPLLLEPFEACAESDMLLTTKVMKGRLSLMLVLDVGSTGDGGARDGRSAGTRVP